MSQPGYPTPSSPGVSARMRANRKVDTTPEVAVRSALWRAGLRFRKDFSIPVPGSRPVRADVAFPRERVAVFVDGCFWHACPEHGTRPTVNADYWLPKLERNVARDRLVDEALTEQGWLVLRAWEHEAPNDVAQRVVRVVSTRRGQRTGGN